MTVRVGVWMGLRWVPTAAVIGLAAVAVTRFGVVTVDGWSMAPALVPGDVCLYRRGSDGISERDIALYTKAGWPRGVLHRIAAVNVDGTLRTRGDANPIADLDAVPRTDIRGSVVAVVPLGRILYRCGPRETP